MLGIPEEYTHFDSDLIIHINSVFSILNQLGVGNSKFMITGSEETWDDFIGTEDDDDIESVRTYMYLKVRMIFDPPTSSIAAEAFKSQIAELEWRLNVEVDDWNES